MRTALRLPVQRAASLAAAISAALAATHAVKAQQLEEIIVTAERRELNLQDTPISVMSFDGNLWCGWGMGDPELDGVVVYAPDGVLIGRIALPERCANLCFGGLKRNRLFMAASQSIYALYVNTQGALVG